MEKLNYARFGELTETPKNGVDEQSSLGYFELTIPGQDAGNSFRNLYRDRSLYKDYEDWQASYGVQESLQGYKADSLRVGEPLTLVVINRATGYLGSASTSVLDVTDQSINIELPDIRLFPPNLQVQVDRQYQVDKGLTAGQTRNYRVGSEGAALTSDQYVRIHTQWVKHDGTALPSELPGYTGRLANLVGDGELNPSSANHFSIAPGKHTEVIKLPNPALSTTAAHQYLHVVGRELNAMPDKPDFGADPASEFPERPGQFVPIKVAVYDEAASEELQETQEALALAGVQQDSSVYRWVYRPEMQYSVHELDITSITRSVYEETIEILEQPAPVLSSQDESLTISGFLASSEYSQLDLLGGDSDLVLALEQYQLLANPNVGEATANQWIFDNQAHLGTLEGSDFLTVNLLRNNDAGNILWEWAFTTIELVTQSDEVMQQGYDFSHPRPVVKMGRDEDTAPFSVSDFTVQPGGFATLPTVTFTLHGSVHCDLADVIEDPKADITSVSLFVSGSASPVNTALEDMSVEIQAEGSADMVSIDEYLPYPVTDMEQRSTRHTFVGRFTQQVTLEIDSSTMTLMIEAENAIGNYGYDSIDLVFDVTTDAGENIVDATLLSVEQNESTERGLFQPLWGKIRDSSLTTEDIADARVELRASSQSIQNLDIIEHPKPR